MFPCKSVGTVSAFVALGFMGAVVTASPGQAAPFISIGFGEPGDSIGFNSLASGAGTASFNAGQGTYVTVDVAAAGVPINTTPGLYSTNISITGAEQAPETYYLWITQSNLTSPTGTPTLRSSFGVTQLSGQMTSVTMNTYVEPLNPTNAALSGLGSLLATETCTTTCSTSITHPSPATLLATGYAETIEYIITTIGFPVNTAQVQGEFQGTASIDLPNQNGGLAGETPLPAALPLFAGGLGVLGLFARRRKHKNAAALAAA